MKLNPAQHDVIVSQQGELAQITAERDQLKQQLAQAKAAWMEACLLLGPDYPGNQGQDWDRWHERRHALSMKSTPQGWLLPDEAKRLEAGLHEAAELLKLGVFFDDAFHRRDSFLAKLKSLGLL